MKVKKKNTFIFMNHFSVNSHFSAPGVLASEKHSVDVRCSYVHNITPEALS